MNYFSKSIFKAALLAKVGWISLTVLACLLVISLNPSPSHLGLILKGEAQGRQKIEFYYLEKSEAKGIAFRHTQDLSQSQPYYFSFPQHFSPDRIVIDLGVPPSAWTIEDVVVHVDFLLFGFDGYRWDMPAIESIVKPIESSTVFRFDEKFHIAAIKEPARFTLNLDYSKARPTAALIVAKLTCILLIISFVMLLASGYLWRLFRYREVDLTTLETNYSFIHSQRRPWLILGAAVLGSVLLYMLFPHIQSPGFHIEDTMQFSDISSGQIDLLNLSTYEYYRGYTVLISEWLVAAANLFPLSWQPHLYLLSSSFLLVFAVITAAHSGIYSSKLVLTIAPSALLFGAFTEPAFYITLTGVLFSSTALLMAISFRPPPTSIAKLSVYLVVACVLAFSGPYGSVLLPLSIALLLFFGTRRNILFLSVIASLSVLYILSAQSGMVTFSNVFDSHIRMVFFKYLVEHIWLLGLFPGIDYPIGFLLIFIAVLSLIIYRRDTLFVKMSLIFLATSLASFLSYFLSSKFQQYAGDVISSHTVIAQFCWVLFVLLCIDRFATTLTSILSSSVFATAVVLTFSCVIITKQSVLADHVTLLPDPNLKRYLTAVQYAKVHPIENNNFLQLWHVDRLGFVTSFHKGHGPNPTPRSELPEYVKPFYLAKNLQRQQKTMFIYDRKESVINVSLLGDKVAPISVPNPAH